MGKRKATLYHGHAPKAGFGDAAGSCHCGPHAEHPARAALRQGCPPPHWSCTGGGRQESQSETGTAPKSQPVTARCSSELLWEPPTQSSRKRAGKDTFLQTAPPRRDPHCKMSPTFINLFFTAVASHLQVKCCSMQRLMKYSTVRFLTSLQSARMFYPPRLHPKALQALVGKESVDSPLPC